MKFNNIVILTGAGVSAESGVATFRDNNGLWENHRVEDVATPEAFDRNPDLVQHFYNLRRQGLNSVSPNKAHHALRKLEKSSRNFLLVTQNVDDLHERAGCENVIHMHGSLLEKVCNNCHKVSSIAGDLSTKDTCVNCGEIACLRPNIVWFGEMPFQMDLIFESLLACDLFISIGTSGTVYPAAGFVEIANQAGAQTVELNLEPSDQQSHFKVSNYGTATKVVPAFVSNIIK